MPRQAKAKAPAVRVKKTSAKGTSKLSLKTPTMDLTLETSDSSVIAGILDQLEVTASAGVPSVGRPKGKRGPKAAAKPAAAKGSILTKTDVAKAMKTANPSNHEQRILLVGFLVKQKGGKVFTTEDIKAAAAAVGISGSTIPGSISKLRAAKMITAQRDGRRAFYTLTAAGEAAAKKILEGTAPTSRRGRKAGTKKAVAKPAAKRGRKPGRKPAAKKAVAKPAAKRGRKPGPKPGRKPGIKAGTKRPAVNKDGSPRKRPGPKPKAGAKKPVAKKSVAKKPAAKKVVKKAVAKKASPKKSAFAKAAAKKAAAKKTVGSKK